MKTQYLLNSINRVRDILVEPKYEVEQYDVYDASLFYDIYKFDMYYRYSDDRVVYNAGYNKEYDIYSRIEELPEKYRVSYNKLMSPSSRESELRHYAKYLWQWKVTNLPNSQKELLKLTNDEIDYIKGINSIADVDLPVNVVTNGLQLTWLPGVDSYAIGRQHRNGVFHLTQNYDVSFITISDKLTMSIVEWIHNNVHGLRELMLHKPWLVKSYSEITPVIAGVEGYEGLVRLNIGGYNNELVIPLITYLRSINYKHVNELKSLLWPKE